MAAWSLVCIPLFLLCYCQLNEALGQPSVVTCTVHSCLAERLDNGDPAGNCNTSAIDERCYSGKQVCVRDCYQQHTPPQEEVSGTVCVEPSNVTVGQAMLQVLDTFGWRRVLMLAGDSWLPEIHKVIGNSSREASIVAVPSRGSNFTDKIPEKMASTLRKNKHKIFVLLYVDKEIVLEILCKAHKHGLFYPGHAWVSVGVDVDELMDTSSDMLPVNCTLDMVTTVLNYSLAIEPAVTLNENEWENCALQSVVRTADENGSGGGDCSRTDASIPLTGNVTFTAETEKPCSDDVNRTGVVVFQYRGGSQLYEFGVAVMDKSCDSNYSTVFINCENETTLYPDGVPSDGSPVRVRDATDIESLIAASVLYGAFLVFAGGCLLFNILFRQRRVVKLTSPTLNCVMILGAMLLGSVIVLYTIPIHSYDVLPPLCISRVGALIIGHDICFGIVLMKLFRIHHIFRNPSTKKKVIKDWHLLLALGGILAVEVVSIATLQAISFTVTTDHGYRKEINRERPVTINETGIIEEHYIIVCGNPPPDYVMAGIAVVIKFTMHFIAVVLAIRTRNIEIEVVNDAKETQAIVYLSTILIILLVSCSFTLEGYANAYGLIIGTLALLESVIFLGFTFILKIAIFCKNPLGVNLFKTDNITNTSFAQYAPPLHNPVLTATNIVALHSKNGAVMNEKTATNGGGKVA